MDGVLLIDKPAGLTSHDVVAAVRRALGGVKTGHAGTLDPFATGLLLVLVGRATQIQQHADGAAQALRDGRAARARVDHRRPRGRDHAHRPAAARPAGAADRRDAPAPADATRRSRSTASAPTGGAPRRAASRCPSGSSPSTRFEQLWRERDDRVGSAACGFVIECSSGTYVRSLIADLGDAYCLELRRTAIGPFERAATPCAAAARGGAAVARAAR